MRYVSIIGVIILFTSCSKEAAQDHLLEKAAREQSISIPISQELYENPQNGQTINVISSDELEYQTERANLICKYSIQESRLRVIANISGTTQALYFEISDSGLHGDTGDFYPQATLDLHKADKCLSQAKQIALACKLFAGDHDGNFPNTLNELAPSYIDPYLLEALLVCPLSPEREAVGYDYFGGRDTDPPEKPLFRAKHTTPGGRRVMVYTDCSGKAALPSKAAQMDLENAKRIAFACHAYAEDHNHKYPETLGELVPHYLPERRVLSSPLSPKSNQIDYDYFGAGHRNDESPDPILIRGRSITTDGDRSIVLFDCSGSLSVH